MILIDFEGNEKIIQISFEICWIFINHLNNNYVNLQNYMFVRHKMHIIVIE